MKRKTALYNIKQAYKTWNPAEHHTEFFQQVNEILKRFEESKDKEKIDTCQCCGTQMVTRTAEFYCDNSYCDNYLKTIR
jgi:hypothetical protein